MVEGFAAHARAFAEGAAEIAGVEVLNDVVFTQVCLTFGDDERTRAVAAALLADGTTWMSGSRWHDRAIVRISVSNWSTTDDDVRRSLDALRRAAETVETPVDWSSPDLLRPAKAAPGDRVAVVSPSFAAPAVAPRGARAGDAAAAGAHRAGPGRVPDDPSPRRLGDRPGGRPQRGVRRPGDPGRAGHHRRRRPDHRDPAPGSRSWYAAIPSRSWATATTPTC